MTNTLARFFGFFALSFLLLALVPAGQKIFSIPSLDFSAMAQAASARTGVPWTSNLVDVLRLAVEEPGLWLLVLGSAVPTLAAVAALSIARDWQGLKHWCGRFNPLRPWREATWQSGLIVVITCFGVVTCLLVTFELRKAVGFDTYARPFAAWESGILASLFLAALLDQGAVLEEGGWRAHATPLLQGGGMQPVYAALFVGAAWGLWHVPRDVVSGVVDRLGSAVYVGAYLPSFLLGTISVSVIAAYCMNRLAGSVFPAIAIHGLANDSAGLSGSAAIELALTPGHQITKALPIALLAVGLILATGPALGQSRRR